MSTDPNAFDANPFAVSVYFYFDYKTRRIVGFIVGRMFSKLQNKGTTVEYLLRIILFMNIGSVYPTRFSECSTCRQFAE